MTVNIKLDDIPLHTALRKIRVSIYQTFTWRSLNAIGPAFTEGPFVFPLMVLSPTSWEQDQERNSVSVVNSVRLPDDRYLAPSTLKNTITPNHISHKIVLEFVVVDEKRQESLVQLSTPVTLACVSNRTSLMQSSRHTL